MNNAMPLDIPRLRKAIAILEQPCRKPTKKRLATLALLRKARRRVLGLSFTRALLRVKMLSDDELTAAQESAMRKELKRKAHRQWLVMTKGLR